LIDGHYSQLSNLQDMPPFRTEHERRSITAARMIAQHVPRPQPEWVGGRPVALEEKPRLWRARPTTAGGATVDVASSAGALQGRVAGVSVGLVSLRSSGLASVVQATPQKLGVAGIVKHMDELKDVERRLAKLEWRRQSKKPSIHHGRPGTAPLAGVAIGRVLGVRTRRPATAIHVRTMAPPVINHDERRPGLPVVVDRVD
jgi:hypothetical protein